MKGRMNIRVQLDGFDRPVLFVRQEDGWFVNYDLDLIINPEKTSCVDRNWYADYITESFTYNFKEVI